MTARNPKTRAVVITGGNIQPRGPDIPSLPMNQAPNQISVKETIPQVILVTVLLNFVISTS
jgi:hypothetical protein